MSAFYLLPSALVFVAGCSFSPAFGNGQVKCSAEGDCPPSYLCASDGLCYRAGTGDMSAAPSCGTLHCFVGWCGPIMDSCGNVVDCGSCNPTPSDGGMTASVDMVGCAPTQTCVVGSTCGMIDDGCGNALHCGPCATPFACSSSVPNKCDCIPKTCADVGATCGQYPDGCGGTLNCYPQQGTSCGNGNSNGTCGGGGPYTCGKRSTCTPLTTCPTNACGDLPDGCSDILHCGSCSGNRVCGGNGKPNRCGAR